MTTPVQSAKASGEFSIGGKLPVTRLGYGAMQLTGPGVWGAPKDPDEAVRVLRRAVDLGVNFIDTADSYGPVVSEELIRKALHPYPADLVIATKAGPDPAGAQHLDAGGPPRYLRQQAEMSLRHLGLEQITLFQLHRIDPQVPLADQVGELAKLQEEGKIGLIGLSEVTVDAAAGRAEIAPIATVQNLYNLANRSAEELLDYSAANGIGFIPWFPLATGELAKPGEPAGFPGRPAGRVAVAAGPGLAAAPLPRHAADPRHVERRAPRGQRRGGRHLADRGRVRRPRGRGPVVTIKVAAGAGQRQAPPSARADQRYPERKAVPVQLLVTRVRRIRRGRRGGRGRQRVCLASSTWLAGGGSRRSAGSSRRCG